MNMKKIALLVFLGLVVIVLAFVVFFDKGDLSEKDQLVLQKTLDISRAYTILRLQTDDVLVNARNYPTYEEWKREMDIIITKWSDMEKEAFALDGLANKMLDEKISFKIINSASAYNKQEISNIFDRAPAGKKIATLAKHLGVDAKRAYAILTQDQAQVQADAWNEAGDTFKKLETTAVVVKDACKVTTFVGTVVLTGGTSAIAAGSTLGKVAVVVAGADLTLEVTDDAAKIALGDKNKISTVIGEARVVTEPAAAILMISTLPSNLTKTIDKLGAVTFGADQLNSSIQEGKVIGISLPAVNSSTSAKNIKVAVLESEEVKEWMNNEVEGFEEQTQEDIEDILNIGLVNQTSEGESSEKEIENVVGQKNDKNSGTLEIGSNEPIVGTWKGILSFTQSAEAEEQAMDYVLEIEKDGRLGGKAGEVYDGWEIVEDNLLRLTLATDEGEGYDEFRLAGDSLTYVKRAGINSEGVWQEDYADSDFFGGKFMQIHLKKL